MPIIPLSLKPWHEIGCPICNFYQDIKYRPDVAAMTNGGGGGGGGEGGGNYQMNPAQGGQGPMYK